MKLPKGSCFLFGPRGTGKSTWIEAELPDALRVDLLQARVIIGLKLSVFIDDQRDPGEAEMEVCRPARVEAEHLMTWSPTASARVRNPARSRWR